MLRRLITVTALAVGLSIAAAMTLATPALAKGPSQARITGPGLGRAVVVSGNGEPGEQGRLASLAEESGLFTVMFGAGVSGPVPAQLHSPPPRASLGPRYTIIYTVPGGITSHPGQQSGQVRQDLYPGAAAGPLVYTPPGQYAGPFPVTGWLRASHGLPRTLARLGIPPSGTQAGPQTRLPDAAHPAAAHQAGSRTVLWLIASAAAIAATALAGFMLLLRHRKPANSHNTKPTTRGPATACPAP